MLRVHAAEGLTELAGALCAVLGDPLDDPMAPELVAVPTAGVKRWLSLELARRLGSSGGDSVDGISANIEMVFPGEFTHRVLGGAPDSDPWSLERVAWVILAELAGSGSDETIGTDLSAVRERLQLAPGATEWARARRIADLFDSYMTHRPQMILGWLDGLDIDGSGQPIEASAAWQPLLWRRIRAVIGVPCPPEATAERIASYGRGDPPEVDLPQRVCMFGLTTVPGGAPLLELLDSLSTQLDVHLMLAQPSLALAQRVASSFDSATAPSLRSADRSAELVEHPLLRSWGRPSRETMLLVGDRLVSDPLTDPPASARRGGSDTPPGSARSLLHQLQSELSADIAPSGSFTPDLDDSSIVIHSAQGDTRQVEVLRDQILHLLADDPTLLEDDIAIICPALERFAPLIESVFGLPEGPSTADSSEAVAPEPSEVAIPRLRYRLADRSLGVSYELISALGSLVELMASRFSERAILDFVSLPAVREAFGFDDDDLGLLAQWVESTNARWGLDGEHREEWGLPGDHLAGTWERALDRLLMGVLVTDQPDTLSLGGLLPVAVEGSGVSLAGRFARLLAQLAALRAACTETHPIGDWVSLLVGACSELFSAHPDRSWEAERLDSLFAQLLEESDGSQTPLSLDDVRHIVGAHLGASIGRPGFFRGGITVCSPTPLRGVPHRVICLLGVDQSAFSQGAADGDDLAAMDPFLGDRDRRSEIRQMLLDTLLAAQDRLVIVRNGADVITNQAIRPAVVLAELIDNLAAMVEPTDREEFLDRLTTVHPRQRFDEANFIPRTTRDPAPPEGGLPLEYSGRPWSFDPVARDGALARLRGSSPPAFATGRLDARHPAVLTAGASSKRIPLELLGSFLDNVPKFFLAQVLEMQLLRTPERDTTERLFAPVGSSGIPPAAAGRDMALEVDFLERWKVWAALLEHRLDGGDVDGFIAAERARDRLPPGGLGDALLESGVVITDRLLEAQDATGAGTRTPTRVACEVQLTDGTVITGNISDHGGIQPGPVSMSMSTVRDKFKLRSWLRILLASAAYPEHRWRAVLLNRKGQHDITEVQIQMRSEQPEQRQALAIEALQVVVGLYRAGLREPLPLFPRLSSTLHLDTAKADDWSEGFWPGDGDDTWIRTAFDHASFDQIRSLPLRPYDPPGAGNDRATRYGSILWSSYFDTAPDTPFERS